MMVELSIIILTYNTKDITLECIQSLAVKYQEELKKGSFEIIVVDNASNDNTAQTLLQKEKKSYVTVVKNKENVGFSKGSNIGVKNAKGKYILFLNSDTKVSDRGLLDMISYLNNHEDVGALGGRLVNLDGSVQLSVGKFYTLFTLCIMLLGAQRLNFLRSSPKKTQEVDWVMGASLMMPRKAFDNIGGFDEHFFMYIEDMEICYRLKNYGYKVVFYPDVTIIHKERGSSNRAFAIFHIYKGLVYFYKKHKNYIQYIVVKILLITKATAAIIVGMITFNKYLVSTYRKAISLLV